MIRSHKGDASSRCRHVVSGNILILISYKEFNYCGVGPPYFLGVFKKLKGKQGN